MNQKAPVTRVEFSEFVDFVKEKVVTKNDLNAFAKKEDLSQFATKGEFRGLKQKVEQLDAKVDRHYRDLTTTLDAILKAVTDKSDEDVMLKAQTSRHDRWIKELAGAVGHELSQ